MKYFDSVQICHLSVDSYGHGSRNDESVIQILKLDSSFDIFDIINDLKD